MCNSFIYYYPARPLFICGSVVSHQEIKNFYQSLMEFVKVSFIRLDTNIFYNNNLLVFSKNKKH